MHQPATGWLAAHHHRQCTKYTGLGYVEGCCGGGVMEAVVVIIVLCLLLGDGVIAIAGPDIGLV